MSTTKKRNDDMSGAAGWADESDLSGSGLPTPEELEKLAEARRLAIEKDAEESRRFLASVRGARAPQEIAGD